MLRQYSQLLSLTIKKHYTILHWSSEKQNKRMLFLFFRSGNLENTDLQTKPTPRPSLVTVGTFKNYNGNVNINFITKSNLHGGRRRYCFSLHLTFPLYQPRMNAHRVGLWNVSPICITSWAQNTYAVVLGTLMWPLAMALRDLHA